MQSRPVILKHGVGGDDKFTHGGDDGDLGRFALLTEMFVERAVGRVASDGNDGGQVQATSR